MTVPWISFWQLESQPSPLAWFPSSQISPTSTRPSPQASWPRQSPRQPSPEVVFPSSQSSPSPLWTTLSPQLGGTISWQLLSQVAVGSCAPKSHCSVPALLTTPSPQNSTTQLTAQPLKELAFP